MTLYEVCPQCKGTRLAPRTFNLYSGMSPVRACPSCKDGYIEHVCPQNDACPCIETYQHDHPERE